MTMKVCNYLTKLPQETRIRKVETFRDYDLITLDVPSPKQRLCPHCGSGDCIIKDSGTYQTVRHIPYNHRGSAVTFHKRRLFCKTCSVSFYETPYWIHSSLRITQALYDSILLDLIEPIAFTEIARRNCITTDLVQSVFDTIHFERPRRLPETLCIDEFKGNSGIWSTQHHRWYRNKYHCNISDGDSHAVIDILDQISGVYLNRYFRQFPPDQRRQVKYFCCDMSNGFVSMAKKTFPEAKICIDPFHIIRRLNDMVDDVRLRYQRRFQDSGDTESFRKVKGTARLLKTKEFNQKEYWGTRYHDHLQKLRDAFEIAPDLHLPPELEDWLLVHFEDEPYEDFNTASVLEDMICMYCQSYERGKLDVTIPDPLTRFKERCEDLKDLIMDLRVDVAYLQELCDHYEQILREHGLL